MEELPATRDDRPVWRYHVIPLKRSLLTGNRDDEGPIILDVRNGGLVHPSEVADDEVIDVEDFEVK